MLVHRTVVLPTDETRVYLSSVLSGAPMDIAFDTFHVILLDSATEVAVDSKAVYNVEATAFNQYYNEDTGQGSLVLSLKSKDLQARYKQLTAKHKDLWFNEYAPYMIIVPYANPDRLHQRRFVGSIANALCSMNTSNILTFGCELQFTLNLDKGQMVEYHNSIVGGNGNN